MRGKIVMVVFEPGRAGRGTIAVVWCRNVQEALRAGRALREVSTADSVTVAMWSAKWALYGNRPVIGMVNAALDRQRWVREVRAMRNAEMD